MTECKPDVIIHSTADVAYKVTIGEGTTVGPYTQVRTGAIIGKKCILSSHNYVDEGVRIGNFVHIHEHVSLYYGVTIEDGVVIGPHVSFTNVRYPRSISPNGTDLPGNDWNPEGTRVGFGASLGANVTIRCGVSIGTWAMIGAGSVVTCDIPDHGLAYGDPARLMGFVCSCGAPLEFLRFQGTFSQMNCRKCGNSTCIPTNLGLVIH